jgi:tRNA U34 5-carboxymethylaminomethyl modifying GTPase MnmE/TrmE
MKNEEDYLKLIKNYQFHVKLLQERFNSEIRSKDNEILIYKSQIDYLQKLVISLSERPIINHNRLEAMAMADQSKSETRNVNYNAPIQGAGYVEGTSYYYASPEQKQSLTEAAAEIKQLLNQLSQVYPTTTVSEQMTLATKAIEEIEKKPQLKQRVIGALQSGGAEALKELVDNPIINVLLAILEGWKSV